MISSIYDEKNAPSLRIIKMGSDVGATKNMTVYECDEDIIVVDCGVQFPDSELLGVDVVIPDMSYLLERKNKVKGLFITHGHEDHIGAVPYFLSEFDVPVYANNLVQGFIKERLKDFAKNGVEITPRFVLFNPEEKPITIGKFTISCFNVNHSVPFSMGFGIMTPQGLVLHIADYKIDWTPEIDKPIDLATISRYGKDGVLCLLSDCLGVTTEGYTQTEKALSHTFDDYFRKAENRQILVTTISTNISRMFQIIRSAIKYGRKIVFSGRSIEQHSRVSRELNYLPFDDSNFVLEKEAKNYKQSDLVYIIAGCYGQRGSSIERLSRGEHNDITLEEGALVIFSADPNPPGVQESFEILLHQLTVSGAEVIYSEIQENLHVSGHGTRGDLMTVSALSKAKYYIPIGGTAAKMRAYSNMVQELGVPKKNIFELLEGDSVIFSSDEASKGEKLELKQILIDGKKMNELSPVVLRDREKLSTEGVFVVFMPSTSEGKFMLDKLEIVTRGFIYVKDSKELMDKSKEFVAKTLTKLQSKKKDPSNLKRNLERELERFLYKETGRNPVVLVHTVEI